MTQVIRPVGYSNSYGELTVTSDITGPVTAYLWGGGGGGGGGPDGRGSSGFGGGGGFSQVNFSVNEGDVIGLAVGGGGYAGNYGGGVGGGTGGSGFVAGLDVSTLNLLTLPDTVRYTNGAYCGFLNTYGIWNTDLASYRCLRTTTINVQYSGYYTVTGSCDNYGYLYIDNALVLTMPDFHYDVSTTVYLSAGIHVVTVDGYNSGGPGCIGARIYGVADCYSGATGGRSGPSGGSGSGGGSGAATVAFLNGTVIGVAGGGGGGGGAGQFSYVSQCDAPGVNDHADSATHNGQNGEDFWGDGGGGGAGGGGYGAGQGGLVRGGEATAFGGAYGLSYSSNGGTENPNGVTAGGTGSPYYIAGVGEGGNNGVPGVRGPSSGKSGYAVFVFNQHSLSIKNNGAWASVNNIFVKQAGSWSKVKAAFVKQNGVWAPFYGANNNVPNFSTVAGRFGYAPRPGYTPPPPPPEDPGSPG